MQATQVLCYTRTTTKSNGPEQQAYPRAFIFKELVGRHGAVYVQLNYLRRQALSEMVVMCVCVCVCECVCVSVSTQTCYMHICMYRTCVCECVSTCV